MYLLKQVQSVNPVDLGEKLYIRDWLPNLIVQKDEVIRFKLIDYIAGPLMMFFVSSLDGTICDGECSGMVDLTYPYRINKNGLFKEKSVDYPLKDTKYLIKDHDKRSVERTFMVIVDEDYMLRIFDLTYLDHGKVSEPSKTDLMKVVNFWIGPFQSKDIFCNSLEMIKDDEIFMLP